MLAALAAGWSQIPMADFFRHPLSLAAFWFAAIFALLALTFMLMRKYRDRAAKDRLGPGEMLTKFREVHAKGGLSDDEYRTIKTKLAVQLEVELNNNEQTS
jgi:uncharacterized membrane protein